MPILVHDVSVTPNVNDILPSPITPENIWLIPKHLFVMICDTGVEEDGLSLHLLGIMQFSPGEMSGTKVQAF
jgi:hypothetical protein